MISRSGGMLVAEFCVRGCTIRDDHYAACPDYGKTRGSGATCWGCTPRPTRGAMLVCDGCYRRFRRMLLDAPDLLGRLQSIAEQDKAVAFTPVKAKGSPAESPVQIGSDLLDALTEISANLHDWAVTLDAGRAGPAPRAGRSSTQVYADRAKDAAVVLRHLDTIVAVEAQLTPLAEAVIVMHQPDDEGARRWSVADAVARWGVERRDRNVYPDQHDDTVIAGDPRPVREWGDELLTKREAEKLAGSPRTLRRWEKRDLIAAEGRMIIAGVVTNWYRRSDILRVKREAGERSAATRFKPVDREESE